MAARGICMGVDVSHTAVEIPEAVCWMNPSASHDES